MSDRDRHERDRDRDRERDRDRDRERDRDRSRERDRDRSRERDRDRSRERGRDRDRDRGYGSSKRIRIDGEREHHRSRSRDYGHSSSDRRRDEDDRSGYGSNGNGRSPHSGDGYEPRGRGGRNGGNGNGRSRGNGNGNGNGHGAPVLIPRYRCEEEAGAGSVSVHSPVPVVESSEVVDVKPEPGGFDESRGRGRGRGGGGGRGRGGRGRGRGGSRPDRDEMHDLVASRSADLSSKRGTFGQPVKLLANFFVLEKRPEWCIYHYRVDFEPDESLTPVKKSMVRAHERTLGAYIFDGCSMYTAHQLDPEPMVLTCVRDETPKPTEITIRLVGQLAPTDIMYIQFFNIIVRKCLSAMQLEELGRHFYDRHEAIRLEAHRLELWPGFKTTMRHHEHDVLLGVEITHKVLRTDNCLNVMNHFRGGPNPEARINQELIGAIVMTTYNRKTYRIDDIDWTSNPRRTFEMGGQETTFADYFFSKYKIRIRDLDQPMLVSRPKRRDMHRGMTGPILLVPETCQMTGLTDEMRTNFQLMKALTNHLHVGPERRIQSVRQFMKRLKGGRDIQDELDRWGLRFQSDIVEFRGRNVGNETIRFGGNRPVESVNADWTSAFRNEKLLASVPLRVWVIIVPQRDAKAIEQVYRNMSTVSRPMDFPIQSPREIIRIPDIRIQSYMNAIDEAVGNHKQNLQLIFIVLPKNTLDIYSAVKKRCCIDYGVPSQCFVAKNCQSSRGLMSICTKVVVQVNAKLGGEPWTVGIPLKNIMVVGFDVYHCGKRKNNSVGAMVASTNATLTKYYSTVSFHTSREELSSNLCSDIAKCLHAYKKVNNMLPDRIIMYRDGVGDGQLTFVYNTELVQISNALEAVYSAQNRSMPKFSFIIVTKKINTRFFRDTGRVDNPEPGTVVDDVITLPERYDFFLISQKVRQGTVSPTSYNVLKDTQGLDADKMQRFTYKLCHLYFNWSGTVTVPAPCQYAHKLAYLTGLSLGAPSSEQLSHLLYFL